MVSPTNDARTTGFSHAEKMKFRMYLHTTYNELKMEKKSPKYDRVLVLKDKKLNQSGLTTRISLGNTYKWPINF